MMTTKQDETTAGTEEFAISSVLPIEIEGKVRCASQLRGRILASHYAEREGVFTALCVCDGKDRAEFGTACAGYYGIYIADRTGDIFLPDIAREEKEAFAIFARCADGCVTTDTAFEVADALLG